MERREERCLVLRVCLAALGEERPLACICLFFELIMVRGQMRACARGRIWRTDRQTGREGGIEEGIEIKEGETRQFNIKGEGRKGTAQTFHETAEVQLLPT